MKTNEQIKNILQEKERQFWKEFKAFDERLLKTPKSESLQSLRTRRLTQWAMIDEIMVELEIPVLL